MILKGHQLNQRQLNAIVPVLNAHMRKKFKTNAEFDDACEQALNVAGCPLGYDTGFRDDMTVEQRAQNWVVNGDVGNSSRAIWCQMMGVTDDRGYRHPYDPDDLNRCLLLLDLIPEWKPRMPEMAAHGPVWQRLTQSWDAIVASFLDEVGLNWCKAKRAPKTYDLMKRVLNGDT